MDPLILARLQFAVTTIYHFFFVPLTLGLSIILAIMETMYVRTGNEKYKRMTKFWGKLFLINFAMGVVTGIVQEFQFGMNWSNYSRFVGDIFGVPLAIEALLAFFLESTFLGIWIFGWDKLSKGLHAAVMWLVAIGSNLSALWILIANSFMHQPVGYVLRNGRAELIDFWAVAFNPHVGVQFPHVFFAGICTAAFFIMGISVYHLYRRSADEEVYRSSFKLGALFGIIGTVFVILVGHTQAQYMIKIQPMKMAAAEALWESEDPAAMSLFTWGDEKNRRDVWSIRVPGLLSFLAYNTFSGRVEGIKNLQEAAEQQYGPGDYVPPVAISYWTFRLMVGAGFVMLFLAILWIIRAAKDKLNFNKRWTWIALGAIGLPYLANSTGWIFTEVARQPWIVFGVLKTQDAISPSVTGTEVLLSLILFTVVYGALMAADIYLLRKYAMRGTEQPSTHEA